MQKQEVDYTDLVITDMYVILTTHKNPWPSNFTKLKKMEFLDKMIAYLEDSQRYEECAKLMIMKEKVANEFIGKGKVVRK